MPRELDELDREILAAFANQPALGVLGASRELGVARATVQARLDRLISSGVIESQAPVLSPAAMGFAVTAFCTLQIQQRIGHDQLLEHLASVPEVLEVHTITGDGDVFARVVARDNSDLQRVIDDVVGTGMIVRTSTVIALAELLRYRTLPLVAAAGSAKTV